MALDRARYRNGLIAANRAILALESLGPQDEALAIAVVLTNALHACRQLTTLRKTEELVPDDASLLDTAIDLLQVKLRYFAGLIRKKSGPPAEDESTMGG